MKRAVVVIALAAAPVLADDVYLKGGGQLTGQIVEQTDDSITVDVGGGTMTVRRASVVRVERSASPLQEYRAKAAQLAADDAEGWRALARWASAGVMSTMASQAWAKVAAVLPNDPEANQALGRVSYNGRWVSEDEAYAAQGYVKFEGEWMRPGERSTILAERQAQAKAEEQAHRQREAAAEQEKRDKDAAWNAEHEFWHETPNAYGDATTWPWGGSGVVYLPPPPAAPARPAAPSQR